jgi:hypothetical protein
MLRRRNPALSMSSSLPASLTAQQQVLDPNSDLLGEVLLHLGADFAECCTTSLVTRGWSAALKR